MKMFCNIGAHLMDGRMLPLIFRNKSIGFS